MTLIILILAAFGIIIGSFLNVVILRFNTGMSISKGRSKCFSCDKTLRWYELFPLASFILQRGRCRGCGSRISWQYPLIELLGGLALPIAFIYSPLVPNVILSLALFALTAKLLFVYIVICAYDFRHKIIPDFFSYGAALIALAAIALEWWGTGVFDWTRLVAGPALAAFFFFFWAVSRGRWMGLGDAKLALSVGWFLGLSQGISAILLSFWTGTIIMIPIMVYQRITRKKGALGMGSEIPFGPFIILGFLLSFLMHIDIQYLATHLAV
ncbi:MAG: prepilin peptidase [Candidatus Paceibacterota bacterium]|jgi:leader peptidase (prepilin peptidase)/N-methyltransferase